MPVCFLACSPCPLFCRFTSLNLTWHFLFWNTFCFWFTSVFVQSRLFWLEVSIFTSAVSVPTYIFLRGLSLTFRSKSLFWWSYLFWLMSLFLTMCEPPTYLEISRIQEFNAIPSLFQLRLYPPYLKRQHLDRSEQPDTANCIWICLHPDVLPVEFCIATTMYWHTFTGEKDIPRNKLLVVHNTLKGPNVVKPH